MEVRDFQVERKHMILEKEQMLGTFARMSEVNDLTNLVQKLSLPRII